MWLACAVAPSLVVLPSGAADAHIRDPSDLTSRFGEESPYAVSPSQVPSEDLVPAAAVETHEMQTADLRCDVGAGGTLVGCRVDWESTPGIGLCPAALAVADRMRLKDHFPDGAPLESLHALVRVDFDTGGRPPYRLFAYLERLSATPFGPVPHPLATSHKPLSADCLG